MEAHKWSWFRRYSAAARVAAALERRTLLPSTFCDEVWKKIQELSSDGEKPSREHESHELFRRELDEQLLLWLNRSVITITKKERECCC